MNDSLSEHSIDDFVDEDVIDFSDFVLGIQSGTIKYEVVPGERFGRVYPLIKGTSANVLHWILTIMSFAVPFIVIPTICYLLSNWLFLFGFAPLWFSTLIVAITLKTSRPLKEFRKFTLALIFLVAILWYSLGPFHMATFLVICFSYEFIFCFLTNFAFDLLVKRSLVRDPDHFYAAIARNRIRLVRE
jgi:hypothetical protein